VQPLANQPHLDQMQHETDDRGRKTRTTEAHCSPIRLTRNLGDAAFARIAGEAEKNCPMSKVLNAAITLDAKLTPDGKPAFTKKG
jgi:organic hydroperoxide reductase OsmC/OhrA